MTERLTAQEWFDKTVGHLRTMSGQAIDSAGHCLYLTPDGNKCAIGIHIPDGHPGQRFGVGLKTLLKHHPDLARVVLPADIPDEYAYALALEMQKCHDDGYHWSEEGGFVGEDKLSKIAEKFELRLHESADRMNP